MRKRKRLRREFVLLCILLALTVINGVILVTRLLRDRSDDPAAAGVMVPAYVEAQLLPENRYSRPGHPLTEINGVVIHYVGNPATTAEANRNYFASLASGAEETYASSHFIVGLEGETILCVPLTEIAYATMERNRDTVSIEVCHPDASGEFSEVSYRRTVELTAWLCHTFELKPESDVIRHYDVTGKLCPKYYVENPDAWNAFLQDVEAALAAMKETGLESSADAR